MSSGAPYKVALITDIPNPYRVPLFNQLHPYLESKGIEMLVIFGSEQQANRRFELNMSDCEFPFKVLQSKRIDLGYRENTVITYRGLNHLLARERPNQIIVIGFTVATMKLWWRSWWRTTKYLIWTGSDGKGDATASFWRKWQRKNLIKRASGFITYGGRAKDYLIRMGAAKDRIHIAVNTSDLAYFARETNQARTAKALKDGKHHILTVSYLSERKNVQKLIDVMAHLGKERIDFVLDILGDGELRDELEYRVEKFGLADRVKFHGFRQKSELPAYFAQSSVLLFHTEHDIWGLVIGEAMSAALPVIASPNAGAVDDLIREGENGFVMDFNYPEEVADKIDWLLENPTEAQKIGETAQKDVLANANIGQSVDGFVSALSMEPHFKEIVS